MINDDKESRNETEKINEMPVFFHSDNRPYTPLSIA